jgi:hypothetical protein
MGATASKGLSNAWSGVKEGLGAWLNPNSRAMILGQVAKRLPTLHEDIAKNANEVSPALGLTAKIASGLIKTIPTAKLAESVLGNVANGSVGGLIGNAIEVKKATPGTYTGQGLAGSDLAIGIGRELVRQEQKPDIPQREQLYDNYAQPVKSVPESSREPRQSKRRSKLSDWS